LQIFVIELKLSGKGGIMTIQQKDCLIHWNYFLALEHDLVECSSYVEFSKENSNAYSIKFAQLLFASSSEVDVIAKEICKIIRPNEEIEGINNYRPVILGRYGLDFKPWSSWQPDKSPFWWQSYNKVKHERNEYFIRSNLINALRSMGVLLITTVYYYVLKFSKEQEVEKNARCNLTINT
jgi:hypothetical protein